MKIEEKHAGYYRVCVIDKDGQTKTDTGWFKNLITNQGLDWIGANPPSYGYPGFINTHCAVGTGSTTPAFTDTLLTTFLAMYPTTASTIVNGFSSSSYVAGPPAYWSGIFTYPFAVGAVVGNITEVGVGDTPLVGSTQPLLFSHSLILDSLGNPTSISITSSDQLVIYYEWRIYINITDTPYTVNISSVTYSGVFRPCDIGTPLSYYLCMQNSTNYLQVYNGSIGPITGQPSGTNFAGSGLTYAYGTYSSGSYSNTYTVNFGISQGNLTGGISAFYLPLSVGNWQFSVSPPIPKDSSHTLSLTFGVSWARY